MGNIVTDPLVFEKCLELLDLKNFRCPHSDTGVKKLLSGAAILLLVDAQLRKLESLSDIEINLRLNTFLQEYIGLDSIHGCSIYRKLEKLPTGKLHEICYDLFRRIHHFHQDKKGIPHLGKLHIVDASEFTLPKVAGEWAYCQKHNNGIKLHLRLVAADENTVYPDRFMLSTSAVSDQEGAIELVVDPEAVYVLDRGYVNYHLYHKWLKQEITFVARLKMNNMGKVVQRRSVPSDSHILKDVDIELKDSKETDEVYILRLVEYTDDKGRLYRVITSSWKHTAKEIAEIYKARWLIELFFKWIKGHLNAVKFFNHKPEAVWNQIYICMIAYALCELIRIQTNTEMSIWEILKRLRHCWLLSWEVFINELNKKPTRKTKGRKKKPKPENGSAEIKAVKIIFNPTE